MISTPQKQQLGKDVLKYLAWLKGRLSSPALNKYEYIDFSVPDDADWFMKVPSSNNDPVLFNTRVLSSCSIEYYRMIVLHECFHLLVQDVPNKIDAKRLKDDFGDPFMIYFDVEADYYTYIYLQEMMGYKITDIFGLNFEGKKLFNDSRIRFTKFERFIGSSLTIVNHFGKGLRRDKELILVSTKNVSTEKALHSIISKSTHFESKIYPVDTNAIEKLQLCYEGKFSNRSDYVRNVIEVCCQLLGIDFAREFGQELAR